MPVPNARFVELLQDIEPSSTTKTRAAGAQSTIRSHLQNQSKFKSRYVTSFLSGSYARDTSIRPRSTSDGQERPDVDIIVETNFSTTDSPTTVLNEVCRALEDGGKGYKVERINKRSVRVQTTTADMDIVPVVRCEGGYMISDRDTGSWKFTNPPVHTSWSSGQNTRFSNRFKPLVKLFKWWRRMNPTSGKRPKGFVLEALVAMHGPISEAHYGEAFAQLLKNVHDAYGFHASIGQKPFIPDPAVPSSDILAKVSVAQWQEFIEKVRVYSQLARRAQDATDMNEATDRWRRVFGSRFPLTSPAAKATSSTATTSAAAVTGYSFSNAMAAPTTKPRGFA